MKNLIRVTNVEVPVYLRKGWFGTYRVIHPLKNPDGSWNYINTVFGGWGNFFKLSFILFIIFCFMYGNYEMNKSCIDMATNPCRYINLDCSRYYNPQNLVEGFEVELGDVKGNE